MTEAGETLPDDTSMKQVTLAVDDRATVLPYYEDIIGLEVVDVRADGVGLGVGDTTLIDLQERPDLPPRPADAAGLFHLAIRVPQRSDLAEVARRLTEENQLTGASDHDVSEALYSRDPAGNGIEVYRDRPREQWSSRGEMVHLTTDPLDLESLMAIGSPSPESTIPGGTDLGHVHLEVTTLEESLVWFTEHLGFEERARYTNGRFIAAGGYHHHVGLNTWNSRRAPASGRGLLEVTIEVPERRALEALERRMAGCGTSVAVGEEGHSLQLRDPDDIDIRVESRA